jgi:hypothetical protein
MAFLGHDVSCGEEVLNPNKSIDSHHDGYHEYDRAAGQAP